jgi:hypothetical protein
LAFDIRYIDAGLKTHAYSPKYPFYPPALENNYLISVSLGF